MNTPQQTIDVFASVNKMHQKYGAHGPVWKLSPDNLKEFLKFRFKFLQEELTEGSDAIDLNDPEEIVDALVDLIVVAAGTLDLLHVDCHQAWNEVERANMAKEVGMKSTRPNPLGFPDLVKPEGWTAPSHQGNHGILEKLGPPIQIAYDER